MPVGFSPRQSHTAHHPIDPGITFRPEDHLAPRYTPHGERRPGARGSTTELSAGGSEIRTLGPPTAVSSVVAPSTRSSLRDKGAGAGAGVEQTTDLLINAPHIKCWSSCPVTSGPRSRSIHARPERQPVGRDGRDADRAGACPHRVDRQGTFRICRTKRFGRSTWLPLCFDRTLECSLSRLKNSQFLPNRSNLLADIMQFIMGLFT